MNGISGSSGYSFNALLAGTITQSAPQRRGERPPTEQPAGKTERDSDAVVVELSKDLSRRSDSNAAKGNATPRVVIKSEEPDEAGLTPGEREVVRELQARDREVRAHEQAHKNTLGPYATGGPFYTYQTGPDQRQYAIGGEVRVDTSPEADPEETLRKADTIRRAALAPAEPSSADRAVAAQANALKSQALAEIREEQEEEKAEELKEEEDQKTLPFGVEQTPPSNRIPSSYNAQGDLQYNNYTGELEPNFALVA